MSIIKKLAQARKMLAAKPLKKSGLNKFAGFQYFELGDFLPAIIEIFAELEIVDQILITNTDAKIMIADADGNSVDFSCAVPESIPVMKGQNELQVIGSIQTYLRRYLYVTALGIVENDVVDGLNQKDEQKAKDDTDAAYSALIVKHMDTINSIKMGINNEDLFTAKGHWDDLDDETKSALWKAPSKNGCFTTRERDVMKTSAFRTATNQN